jgi:hypothetical protein
LYVGITTLTAALERFDDVAILSPVQTTSLPYRTFRTVSEDERPLWCSSKRVVSAEADGEQVVDWFVELFEIRDVLGIEDDVARRNQLVELGDL